MFRRPAEAHDTGIWSFPIRKGAVKVFEHGSSQGHTRHNAWPVGGGGNQSR